VSKLINLRGFYRMKKRAGTLVSLILCIAVMGLAHTSRAAEEEDAPKPDPKTQQAIQYYKEGVRAARAKAYEEAIQWFNASLKLKPEVLAPRFSLGYVLEKAGRLTEAEQAYRDVLSVDPDNPKAYLNLGNVLESQGKLTDAEKKYQEALRLKPDFSRAHNNLAWLWVSARDPAVRRPQKAHAHAKEAVRLTERMEAGPLDTLAETQYALGQCLKAVWTAQEAVSEEPEDPQYKKSLRRFKLCRDAQWAARDGDVGRARKLWHKILAFEPDDWHAREELARLR
jgi:Flp pilus assembly protein TadD